MLSVPSLAIDLTLDRNITSIPHIWGRWLLWALRFLRRPYLIPCVKVLCLWGLTLIKPKLHLLTISLNLHFPHCMGINMYFMLTNEEK